MCLPGSALHLRDAIDSYIHCKWTIGFPDMAIFVGIKIYFWRIKRFPFEIQKDNFWYFCNVSVTACGMVIKYSSLSLIFLLQNLLFWPFFQGNIKIVFRRPFWLQLYSLYSCWLLLIYAPVQRALQRNLPSCQFLWIFQTKPLKSFFAKKTPKTPWLIRWFSTWEAQIAL